jgi:hypothetical protein
MFTVPTDSETPVSVTWSVVVVTSTLPCNDTTGSGPVGSAHHPSAGTASTRSPTGPAASPQTRLYSPTRAAPWRPDLRVELAAATSPRGTDRSAVGKRAGRPHVGDQKENVGQLGTGAGCPRSARRRSWPYRRRVRDSEHYADLLRLLSHPMFSMDSPDLMRSCDGWKPFIGHRHAATAGW